MLEAQSDPSIRYAAEELIAQVQSKDYLSEILAVYYFVLRYTRYANDPRPVEMVKRPAHVIKQILAGQRPSLDCEDMVTLQAAMLVALGREVRAVTAAFADIFYQGERQYSHIYLQAREPRTGAWVTLDPVAAEDTGTMLRRVRAVKIWPIA